MKFQRNASKYSDVVKPAPACDLALCVVNLPQGRSREHATISNFDLETLECCNYGRQQVSLDCSEIIPTQVHAVQRVVNPQSFTVQLLVAPKSSKGRWSSHNPTITASNVPSFQVLSERARFKEHFSYLGSESSKCCRCKYVAGLCSNRCAGNDLSWSLPNSTLYPY